MITGINVVRNCIENGYPLVEAILSTYPMCEEYLVNDGGSTDGTLEVLERLSLVYPNIKILQIPDKMNIRWDSISAQINHMLRLAKGGIIFLGNADELIHEKVLPHVKKAALEMGGDVLRFERREIVHNWGAISEDYYEPARLARNHAGIHQNWNSYGGDEFLFNYGWADPERENLLPITLYHLYNLFPLNKINKLRNDAEHLAPGDEARVKLYELYRNMEQRFILPETVYPHLPALTKELPYLEKYAVRECLFDKKWVEKTTGLQYS